MSKEDKSAVLQAMKKMKKANKNVADTEQTNSGSRSFKGEDREDISDRIVNAVSNLKKD